MKQLTLVHTPNTKEPGSLKIKLANGSMVTINPGDSLTVWVDDNGKIHLPTGGDQGPPVQSTP